MPYPIKDASHRIKGRHRMQVTIIVAHDINLLIGDSKLNLLPWHIPDDLKLFKKRTMGCPVIMGHKTWDSLPKKPLPGRDNFVVSRSLFSHCLESIVEDRKPIATMYGGLECAISSARYSCVDEHNMYDPDKEVYIIGGAQLYSYALEKDLVDKIVATRVKKAYEGDIYFPKLDPKRWEGELESNFDDFEVWIYKRIAKLKGAK